MELALEGTPPADAEREAWSNSLRDVLAGHMGISARRIILEYIRAGSVICGVRIINLDDVLGERSATSAAMALQSDATEGSVRLGAFTVVSIARIGPPLGPPSAPPPTPISTESALEAASEGLSGADETGASTNDSTGVVLGIVLVAVGMLAFAVLWHLLRRKPSAAPKTSTRMAAVDVVSAKSVDFHTQHLSEVEIAGPPSTPNPPQSVKEANAADAWV